MTTPAAAWRGRLAPLRDRLAGLPLRVRLAVAVTVIALAGLVATGAATLSALHSYLIGRVDSDLSRVATRPDFVQDTPEPGRRQFPPNSIFAKRHRPELPSTFYVAHYQPDGRVDAALSSPLERQSPPKLPVLTAGKLRQLEGEPFTAPSTGGGSSWRVVLAPEDNGGTVAVAESLSSTDSTVNRLLLLEVGIGLIALVLMAGGGYYVVRRSLRPLTEVEQTAAAISGGDLSRRVPRGDERTEVGRLAAALNVMLSQIESAFAARGRSERQARISERRMRQFVADASHELRTPLTSIRGFAELYRMGGAGTDDAEVGRLMSRIETESTRMGGLVEDLLMLARLDEQRPLDHQPVDLVTVAGDAVHDAQALDPDRAMTVSSSGPVMVSGDEQRLRQVVHNLVGNALTHTPPGTPIEVTVAPVGDPPGWVRLRVVDHGPGIPPDQADHVFERFWRAEASRTRAAGGSGLGLAIVAEIVAAHDGRVAVEPTPGGGATFSVTLPVEPARD